MESWTLNSGCLQFYLGNIVVTSADLPFVTCSHQTSEAKRSTIRPCHAHGRWGARNVGEEHKWCQYKPLSIKNSLYELKVTDVKNPTDDSSAR